MTTLVFDPGYSSVKWAVADGGGVGPVTREPTAVAEVPDWAARADMPGDAGGIEWRGRRFLVGEEALMAGLPLPTLADGFLTELAIPLFLRSIRERVNFDRAAVLISPADSALKGRIEAVAREALGEVETVFVAQGAGIWFEAGGPSDALVLDVGFNTVDVLVVSRGRVRRDLSFSIRGAGLVSFLERVERDDPFMLARRLEGGDARLAEAAAEHYPGWLWRQLEARTEWRRRPDAAVIAGGGGARFLRGVRGVRVVRRPETANVRGVAAMVEGGMV